MRENFSIDLKHLSAFVESCSRIATLYTFYKDYKMFLEEILDEANEKIRLDIFLSNKFQISRSQANKLISNNLVSINGIIANKSGILLKTKDKISIAKTAESHEDFAIKSDIFIERIYEDNDILVLNKPPFLATHGAPSLKEESLVDWLKAHKIQLSNISGEKKEGIIHRLDKQTSGALVVAKNNDSHRFLSTQLADKTMGRIYLAIIDMPLKDNVEIECFLARNPSNRLKISKVDSAKLSKNPKNARFSKSKFSKILLSNDGKKELILAQLFTGRTHQIRAHLESINRHIIGDELYGYKGKSYRIMLHSYLLYLTHLKNGRMHFIAKLFDDMNVFLQDNFDMEKIDEILCKLPNRFDF